MYYYPVFKYSTLLLYSMITVQKNTYLQFFIVLFVIIEVIQYIHCPRLNNPIMESVFEPRASLLTSSFKHLKPIMKYIYHLIDNPNM